MSPGEGLGLLQNFRDRSRASFCPQWPTQELPGREELGSDTLPASSISITSPASISKAPAKTVFDGWADSIAAALIGPNPSGVSLAGQRTRRRCLACGQDRAMRCKRPAGSCGFLACAPLRITARHRSPAAGAGRVRENCPWFRTSSKTVFVMS